jgi:ferredoxin
MEHAPAFWRMSKKDGQSVLLNSIEKSGRWNLRIREVDIEVNKKAAEACPVKVIEIL